jgi:hypothetical protein
MALKVKIRPLAFLDLDEAASWYNFQREGLGREFLLEVDFALERLIHNPLSYSIIFSPVRRILLKRFPYKILFVLENEEIVILGVVHSKRSTNYLKKRFR